MEVLTRQRPVDALGALVRAYRPEQGNNKLAVSAIILDSSTFLRLGKHEDVVDYLNATHQAPIVLPGQAIQEFWNSNLNVAESIAVGINKKFEALKSEISKVDPSFQAFPGKFAALLEEFRNTYGYAYDGNTVRRTMSLFEMLQHKAVVTHASRARFAELAISRKRSKTPPGFKDDGDGDFLLWVDLLKGLLIARERGDVFDRAILVTEDKKVDWSREGVAHPILSAELEALVEVPFQTWDLARLVREVAAASN